MDLNKDGRNEKIIFYDSVGEFENQVFFNKFKLIINKDTLTFTAKDGWTDKKSLYENADININDRIGVFISGEIIYLWLTGPQYGCCLNQTTIYKIHNGFTVQLDDDFEFIKMEVINGNRYFSGYYSLSEYYSPKSVNINFLSFFPKLYYKISTDFKVDTAVTIIKNNVFKTIEHQVDIFKATLLFNPINKDTILISKYLEDKISTRKYSIASLFRLNEDYLQYFSGEELKIMRNEIFAQYGYTFNSKELQDHFKKELWYKPTNISIEEINGKLSEVEKYNIDLIKNAEN